MGLVEQNPRKVFRKCRIVDPRIEMRIGHLLGERGDGYYDH